MATTKSLFPMAPGLQIPILTETESLYSHCWHQYVWLTNHGSEYADQSCTSSKLQDCSVLHQWLMSFQILSKHHRLTITTIYLINSHYPAPPGKPVPDYRIVALAPTLGLKYRGKVQTEKDHSLCIYIIMLYLYIWFFLHLWVVF